MQCDTDGTNIQPFFSRQSYNQEDTNVDFSSCSCPTEPFIEKTFAIDHSNLRKNPLLIFVDSDSQNIMSADKFGCNCNTIANSNLVGDSFPLRTLKSDFGMLYWTNSSQGLVYSLRKNENGVAKWEQISANNMLIFGSHMQPYPPHRCLIPKSIENLEISLFQKTSTTLTIILPDIQIDNECQNISIPTAEYRISYMPYNNGDFIQCDEHCNKITTFEKHMVIKNLQPFTKYIFFLTVSNYYSRLMQENFTNGPTAVFQTSAGGK